MMRSSRQGVQSRCLVAGLWVGDPVDPVTNPATGDVIAHVPRFGRVEADRRTYHLELTSDTETYMASVSWHYPRDELLVLRRRRGVTFPEDKAGRGDVDSLGRNRHDS